MTMLARGGGGDPCLDYWQLLDSIRRAGRAAQLPWLGEHLIQARAAADAARRQSELAGDRSGQVRAEINAGLLRGFLGDLAGCAARLASALSCGAADWDAGYLDFGRGMHQQLLGKPALAVASFRDAGEVFRSCQDDHARAAALNQLSRALVEVGAGAAAREPGRDSLWLCWQAGDWFGLLATLLPAVPGTALSRLTPREGEVARLLTAGLTNRQIASRIAVTERTVDSHVQRILAKLGCASRVQVAVLVTTELGRVAG